MTYSRQYVHLTTCMYVWPICLYVFHYVPISDIEVFSAFVCLFSLIVAAGDRFGDVMDGEMDWSDGDFIFLSGYSFPDDLLSAVFDKARALKMGSKVVTLSLPEDKDKLHRKFHPLQFTCAVVVAR